MQKKSLGKRKTVADIVLIVLLLLIGLSVFLCIEIFREPGAVVRVYVDGEAVAEYPLSSDGEYSLNGGSNILVIEGGEAYVRYATCPDGLCIGQGKISRTGEQIVCLPNRVMVEVFGAGEEIFDN